MSIIVEIETCNDYRRLREIERAVKNRLAAIPLPQITAVVVEGIGLSQLDMDRIHSVVRADVLAQMVGE